MSPELYRLTHQSHYLPHSALNVQNLGALNTDKAPLAAELREENIGTVHLHHLPDLVETIKQNVVNLVGIDDDILDVDLDSHHQLPQLLFGTSNLFLGITRDVHLIFAAAMRTWRSVAENPWEGWGKVDCRAGGRFDELDVLARPTADQGVHGQLQSHGIHMTFQLAMS
jgi:hypothetical protein